MNRAAIEAIKDVTLNTKDKYETLKIITAELLAEDVVLNTMCLPNAVSTLETFLEETRALFYKTIESSNLSYSAIVKSRNQNIEHKKLLAARALLKERFLNDLDFLQGYIANISMVIFFDRLGITDKEERDRLSLEIMNLIFELGLHAKSLHELRDRREKEAAGLTELDAAYYWNGLPHKEADQGVKEDTPGNFSVSAVSDVNVKLAEDGEDHNKPYRAKLKGTPRWIGKSE